jgi:hypothetical protein
MKKTESDSTRAMTLVEERVLSLELKIDKRIQIAPRKKCQTDKGCA